MSIFGLKCKLHPLFILIMLGSVLTGYFFELAVLFGIVLIHELGHVAAAEVCGWKVKEVQLLPFGGVAVVEQQGVASAWEEIFVALAGPLQNGIMIGIALLLQWSSLWSEAWSSYFIQANLLIGLFNLIPIIPLDGGKVLQAVFSLFMTYYRSLQFSYLISLSLSLFMIGYALFQAWGAGIQLNLLMIGIFIFYSNWYGLRHLPYQFFRFLLHRELQIKALIKRGLLAEPIIVREHMPLHQMLRLLMRGRHHLYYLINRQGMTQAVYPEIQLIQQFCRIEPRSGDAKPPPFM